MRLPQELKSYASELQENWRCVWQNGKVCLSLLHTLREVIGEIPLRIHVLSDDIKEEMLKSMRGLAFHLKKILVV